MRSIFVAATLAFSTLVAAAPRAVSPSAPQPKFVVFGDSFSDDGHGLFAISKGTLPPSPPYSGGRFSDGPVWPEQLAPSDVKLNYTLKDNAIAAATAGTSPFLVQNVFTGQVHNIPNVHAQIQKYISSDEFQKDSKAFTVYAVFIGVNDYSNMESMNLNLTASDVVSQITKAGDTLASAGAKNLLFFNLPPVTRWPSMAPFASTPKELITEHNSLLKAAVIKRKNGAQSKLFDTHSLFSEVLDNPAKYGFDVTDTTCLSPAFTVCEHPDRYLFWDALHFTTKMHKILGNAVGESIVEGLGQWKWN